MSPPEATENPVSLYWRLTLNQQAINLSTVAPHDTFRLVATPRTRDGTPIEGLAAPRFTSADPLRVVVSPEGLVRGMRAGQRIRVVASVTDPLRKVTHTDTVLVSVTTSATPPVLARLVLEPDPADSAKATVDGTSYFTPAAIVARGFDAADNPIANLAVWITSSDPLTASYDNQQGTLTLRRAGRVTFYARTVAYGVERADTLEYTVGLPLFALTKIRMQFGLGGATTYRFDPATVTVGTGAYVFWVRSPNAVPKFDVTFEDPTHVAEDQVRPLPLPTCLDGTASGNIVPFGDTTANLFTNLCVRHFPVPGTYSYRSETLGTTGTVVVVDEAETTPAAP